MTDYPAGRARLAIAQPPDDEHPGPPSDIAAERACLGAMLLSRQAIDDVLDTVTGPEFYRPAHELIYDAIWRLHNEGEPADAVTVGAELARTGDAQRSGGQAYLHDLIAATPLVSNAAHYASIIADKAAARRLVETGLRITQLGYAEAGDIADRYDVAADELAKTARWLPAATESAASTWAPVDLDDALDGRDEGPTAALLTRRDGKHLLYPRAVHSIAGEPGSGKTWVALVAAAQELELGHVVLFIDFEDRAGTVVARLRALGVPDEQIRAGLRYVRPTAALDAAAWRILEQAATGATLAVIDGITEAMALHGFAINENDDVAKWLHLIPNRIADLGPAVVQIDHVTKNSDTRGRYAIGAQHKLAGITGVAYKMLVVKSLGKGSKGHAKLVIDKDKHGDVGPNGVTAADLHHDASDPSGRVWAWLDSPESAIDDEGHFRPTVLMGRVSMFLLARPGAASLNDIKKGVKGSNDGIAQAVDALIREGHIRVEQGPNRSTLHHLVEAFEEEDK